MAVRISRLQMSVDETKLEDTILGILLFAKEQGVHSLLKTALIKYLYLLDVFNAEEQDGSKTWTELTWKFYHFGPFSVEIQSALDKVVTKGKIVKNIAERDDATDAIIYTLSEYQRPKSLKELGLSGYVTTRLKPVVYKYSHNLPGLLNYVYFDTLPMEDANPNDELDFSFCRKFDIESFKPVKLTRISKKKIDKVRKELKVLIRQAKQTEEPTHLMPSTDSLSYKDNDIFTLPLETAGKINIKKD